MQSAISGTAGEIQPHQHLISVAEAGLPVPGGVETVDAARPALYKGANGGGRNPAAAVL
jgi:D-ribose pyranose/furanose isomerase RbsD